MKKKNPYRYHYNPKSGICYCKLDFLGCPGFRIGDDGIPWTQWRFPVSSRRPQVLVRKWKRMHLRNARGYRTCLLKDEEGSRKSIFVHDLVLLAFAGPRLEGMECRHFPDRTRSNNCLENLAWGTHKQNMEDMVLHGSTIVAPEERRKRSERMKGKNLTEATRKKISTALRGRQLSETHKENIRNTLKGRRLSKTHVRKVRKALKKHYEQLRKEWFGSERERATRSY
jgi:hypothetical protein